MYIITTIKFESSINIGIQKLATPATEQFQLDDNRWRRRRA